MKIKNDKEAVSKKIIFVIIIILIILLVLFKGCSNNQTSKIIVTFSGNRNIHVEYAQAFDPESITILINEKPIDIKPVIDLSNVNYNKLGKYNISIKYIDDNGVIIYEETRYIEISDTTAPELLLKGSSELKIPLNSTYVDDGYVVTDNYNKQEDIKVLKSGDVDVTKVGTYTITYTATDTNGNKSTINRKIIVEQTTEADDENSNNKNNNTSIPEIKPIGVTTLQLRGTSTIYVEYSNKYNEAGFTAIDTTDGDISEKVVISGSVDIMKLGTYTLSYTVTNSGNKKTIVTRTVIVRDTILPVMAINGDTTIYHEVKTAYLDLGATASDNREGILAVKVNSTVNPNVIGIYHVTYTATDSLKNVVQKTRTVIVKDTTPPVIDVIDETVNIEWYVPISDLDSFIRNNIIATDNYDGDVTEDITYTISSTLDVMVKGTYTVTYTVKDKDNNISIPKTRIINVQETTEPEGNATYSTIAPTNQDITITITTNKPINTPDSWTKINDKTFSKVYSSNTTETVIIESTGGYTSAVNVSITNIDKTDIIGTVTYTPSTSTNLDVIAEIETNKEIITPSGWSKVDTTHYKKTYINNTLTTETITLNDPAGNTKDVNISVTNIDKVAPTINIDNAYLTVSTEINEPIVDMKKFIMQGVTASDNTDGNITDDITYVVSPTFDITTEGSYIVTYSVKDSANNNATSVVKTINVVILETITMTSYEAWPAGFVSTNKKFSGGLNVGNDIWLIPSNSNQLIKINRETGIMTGYSDWPAGVTVGEDSFRNGVYDGQYIWLIPYYASRVVRVTPETGEMVSYGSWPAGFSKQALAFHGGVDDGDYLWLIPHNATHLVRLNKTTGAMTSYNSWPAGFTKENNGFRGGINDGDYIWLLPYSANRFIKMNKTTGEMIGYNSWPSGFSKGTFAFNEGVLIDNNIWVFPYNADSVISINKTTGAMTRYNNWPTGFSAIMGNRFMGGTYNGESIWLATYSANQLVRINPTTGKMKGYNNWPTGFALVSQSFAGAVSIGTNEVWLIPFNAEKIVKVTIIKHF